MEVSIQQLLAKIGELAVLLDAANARIAELAAGQDAAGEGRT
jgi:hypothetical protein